MEGGQWQVCKAAEAGCSVLDLQSDNCVESIFSVLKKARMRGNILDIIMAVISTLNRHEMSHFKLATERNLLKDHQHLWTEKLVEKLLQMRCRVEDKRERLQITECTESNWFCAMVGEGDNSGRFEWTFTDNDDAELLCKCSCGKIFQTGFLCWHGVHVCWNKNIDMFDPKIKFINQRWWGAAKYLFCHQGKHPV